MKVLVEYVSTDSISPGADNPRRHPRSHIRQLTKAVKELGLINPIIVGEDGIIVAGHARHLVAKALPGALYGALEPGTARGMLHHSGRGSQYASGDFRVLLDEHGIECSMSGAGNCSNDAAVESWFGVLKRERVGSN